MQTDKILRSVRAEINARRMRGGAEDVPAWLWDQPAVGASLRAAVEQAVRDDFDGDWQEASLALEERLDALAADLRSASRRVPMPTPHQARPAEMRDAMSERGREGSRMLPLVVRHDKGSAALADYLSWRLRSDGFFDYYRRIVCGGECLTREEAWQFLTSPLPKVLHFDDYERLGLCPARAQGRILSKYLKLDGLFFYTNMLMVDPKTGVPTATTDTLHGETDSYCVEVSLPGPHGKTRRLKRLVLHRSREHYIYVSLLHTLPGAYQVPGAYSGGVYLAPHPAPFYAGEGRYVEGYGRSVMAELILSAHLLCEGYPVSIWDTLEALLTGTFPLQPSIVMSNFNTRITRMEAPDELPSVRGDELNTLSAMGPVTLTVQPWVAPEALADAWRECRKRNAGYAPSAMQADALRFALSHTPPGEEFAWERLARQWQEERGERMTRGELHKRFGRARSAILPAHPDKA